MKIAAFARSRPPLVSLLAMIGLGCGLSIIAAPSAAADSRQGDGQPHGTQASVTPSANPKLAKAPVPESSKRTFAALNTASSSDTPKSSMPSSPSPITSIELRNVNVTVSGNLSLVNPHQESFLKSFILDTKITDWLLVFSTGLLWLSTRALWVAAGEQARLTREQAEIAREHGAIAREQAEISREQAALTKEQADIAKEQGRLAKEEFVSTHRPEIMVRAFRLKNGVIANNKLQVSFVYFNRGSTDAKIHMVSAAAMLVDIPIGIAPAVMVPPSFSPLHISPPKAVLACGDFSSVVALDIVDVASGDEILYASGRKIVLCVGHIEYFDNNEMKRRTGFARWFSNTSKKFEVTDDDEYEFAY